MNRDGLPAVVYLHPWEVDPAQPRIDVPLLTAIRHYRHLDKVYARLDALTREFRFGTVSQLLAAFPGRGLVPLHAEKIAPARAFRPQPSGV